MKQLRQSSSSAVFLGQISTRHPQFAEIDLLARELALLTESKLGYISEGSNAAGLALAGILPHRTVAGSVRSQLGRNAAEMLSSPPRGMILLGVEPDRDCAGGATFRRERGPGDFLICLSPYMSEWMRLHADVVLPVATAFETSGTFVNAEGRWQSFTAVAQPVGESRPAWKVLRVLANRAGLPDCNYNTADAIRDDLRKRIGEVTPNNLGQIQLPAVSGASSPVSLADLDAPMYQVDAMVRRAVSLQRTADGMAVIPANPEYRRA